MSGMENNKNLLRSQKLKRRFCKMVFFSNIFKPVVGFEGKFWNFIQPIQPTNIRIGWLVGWLEKNDSTHQTCSHILKCQIII